MSTDAEQVLRRLRTRQLADRAIRRQAPIGLRIADFACFEQQLIAEVDGGQHQAKAQADAGGISAIRL